MLAIASPTRVTAPSATIASGSSPALVVPSAKAAHDRVLDRSDSNELAQGSQEKDETLSLPPAVAPPPPLARRSQPVARSKSASRSPGVDTGSPPARTRTAAPGSRPSHVRGRHRGVEGSAAARCRHDAWPAGRPSAPTTSGTCSEGRRPERRALRRAIAGAAWTPSRSSPRSTSVTPERRVVDHDRELIRRPAVALGDHEVAADSAGLRAAEQVIEGHRVDVDPEPDCGVAAGRRACGLKRLELAPAGPRVGGGILPRFVRC